MRKGRKSESMIIKTVTITGADESVQPEKLMEISKEFPFVEWGLLVNQALSNGRRFPGKAWLLELEAIAGCKIKTSAHLCGNIVDRLLVGDGEAESFREVLHNELPCLFKRLQINTHGFPHTLMLNGFINTLRKFGKKIIIQYDQVNNHLLNLTRDNGIDSNPLFDLSHGAGRLPDEWPYPIGDYCGYSGGLGPDNLLDQLKRIEGKVGDKAIWIDMETQVRSNNDMLFDLKKVRKCLEIVQNYK